MTEVDEAARLANVGGMPADGAVPSISLRGVSKAYGDHIALAPTDLDIAEGEFFCMLGPSGGGKTTLLNLIGGFSAPDSGTIAVRGERVERVPPHKRCVNTVFQGYALFPHMTASENVNFGLKMAKVPKREAQQRVREALEMVGLGEYGHRFPRELSGGQQQRVSAARALVNRPAVLLLDEPLGALDLKLRKRLQVELAQIHRDIGCTFVYVTHDQDEAMSLATRIAVVNEGRIEQIGTGEEIYARPRTRFVAGFIGESNFFTIERRPAGGMLTLHGGAQVPSPSSGPSGSDTLMVRPECLRLAAPGDEGWGVPGRIVQTAFLGNHVRLVVESAACDGQVLVSLYRQGLADSQRREVGDEVMLRWEPDEGILLVASLPSAAPSPAA